MIIHLPESVRLVSLSATVSNAEEFGDWLVTVRGDTTVVVEEHRPVPLWQHVLVGHRLYDLFVDDEASAGTGGQPGAARASPATTCARTQVNRRPPQRPRRRDAGRSASDARAASTSSSGSTARACCRRSRSSSAGPAATPPSSSACAPGCG